MKRLEKEMNRKEEQLDQNIDRLEKNMTGAFNKFRVECENLIQKTEVRIEEGHNHLKDQMMDFKEKLAKVEETAIVKQWVTGYVESRQNEINNKVDKNEKEALSAMDQLI